MGWRSDTPASALAQLQILYNTPKSTGLGRIHTAGGCPGQGACSCHSLLQVFTCKLRARGDATPDSTLVSPVYFFPFSPKKGVQSKVLQTKLEYVKKLAYLWKTTSLDLLWQESESMVGDHFWREMLPHHIGPLCSCWCTCTGSLEGWPTLTLQQGLCTEVSLRKMHYQSSLTKNYSMLENRAPGCLYIHLWMFL